MTAPVNISGDNDVLAKVTKKGDLAVEFSGDNAREAVNALNSINTTDAFARLRVSNPLTLFDSKQISDNQPLFWDEELESGAGITTAHSADTASTTMTSTASTAGQFTRQTFMSFNYQPGKSQLIFMTGVLNPSGGGTGVQRRIGQFNNDNGLYFEDNEGTVQVVRRTNVTGSAVNNAVTQSCWNVDMMDGTGVSGITIDWTKTQIFVINYEWLGVGVVKFAMVVDGILYPVHQMLHTNVLDEVYMSRPNLPLKYQMITTGSSPASTLKCICSTVISEGGSDDLGVLRYASTDGTHVACATDNVVYAIIGIRLKAAHIFESIKMQRIALQIQTSSENGEWIWMLNPTVGGTFTYADETNSSVQIARGAATNTVTNGTWITGGYAESTSGGGGSGGVTSPVPNAILLGADISGNRDEMVLCWIPRGGTSNHQIEGSLTWRELS